MVSQSDVFTHPSVVQLGPKLCFHGKKSLLSCTPACQPCPLQTEPPPPSPGQQVTQVKPAKSQSLNLLYMKKSIRRTPVLWRNDPMFCLMHRMTELVTSTLWGWPCQRGWAFIDFIAMVEMQCYLVILSCKTDLLTVSLPVVRWNRWFPEKLFTD